MSSIKAKLALLILGQKGGLNRLNILNALSKRPFNTNQLAEALELNYHTVQYHLKVLLKNDIVTRPNSGGYGDVFFLAPELDAKRELLEDIGEKLVSSSSLTTSVTSDKFFKQIMEQVHDTIIILDTKGQVFFWNKSAEELFGYGEEETIGEKIQIFSGKESFMDLVGKLDANNHLTAHQTRAVDKQGEMRDIEITLTVINDEHGEKSGYAFLARDITKRIEEESIIRENEQALSLIFENSPVGMVLANNDLTIYKINNTASSFLHQDADNINGMRPGEAFRCVHHLESSEGCGTAVPCRVCPVRGMASDTARTGMPYNMVDASLNVKDGNDITAVSFTLSTIPIYHEGERKVLLILQHINQGCE